MGDGIQIDANADGRRLTFLNLIDEYSRLSPAIRVGKGCKAKDVAADLEDLASLYPAPAFIRSDNGPEFSCCAEAQGLAQALRDWCAGSTTNTSTACIGPGSPGRTDSWNLSMAGSGMSFSTPSCSPQRQRHRSWPTVGSTTQSGRNQTALGPPGAAA